MKRLFLFFATNIAAVAMLSIAAFLVCSFFGVDLSAALGEGGYAPLLVFSFVMGMAGSLISLFLSKTMVKVRMKCRVIDGTEGEAERWLVATVEDLARRAGVKTPEEAARLRPAQEGGKKDDGSVHFELENKNGRNGDYFDDLFAEERE